MPGSFSSESWLNRYRNGGLCEPKYPQVNEALLLQGKSRVSYLRQ
jgi:hypothetical protein